MQQTINANLKSECTATITGNGRFMSMPQIGMSDVPHVMVGIVGCAMWLVGKYNVKVKITHAVWLNLV